ncbi:MAG: hypothetical protein U1D30_25390 [Planctomycetota bacterium]
MQWIRSFLALAMVACLASDALAAKPKDKGMKTPEQLFEKADKNGDKKLSLEEFLGKRADDADKKAKVTERFGKLDKDGDKSLTIEEFKAGIKKKK